MPESLTSLRAWETASSLSFVPHGARIATDAGLSAPVGVNNHHHRDLPSTCLGSLADKPLKPPPPVSLSPTPTMIALTTPLLSRRPSLFSPD